jgi:ornithine--oxo-acid transaminase
VAHAEGAWVTDVDGRRFLDMLSAYSALNQGHRHPRILAAAREQLDRVTLTSRAFHNDKLGPFLERLSEVSGFERALPMNSGAEAVETALKAMRKWGYAKRGVGADKAEIIVAHDNFHGRTISIVSFSTEAAYRDGFGPFTPGFVVVPFGDAAAIEAAITPNTAAVFLEPIQGEAGIIVPPDGYLRAVRETCTRHGVLLVLDEIQTGLGRTGKMWAFQHEDIRPDAITIGKALGGGVYPVSAFCADEAVMEVFHPGTHGSTFGGNPFAAAVATAALDVLVDERLPERAAITGAHFVRRLRGLHSPKIKEVRGKGLLIGVELHRAAGKARPYCEALMNLGVLCKDTHEQVIRFAPPLVLTDEDLEWAMERIGEVLA